MSWWEQIHVANFLHNLPYTFLTMAIFPFGNFLRDPRPLSAIVSIRWHSLCFLFSQSCFYVYCPGSLLLVLLLSCLPLSSYLDFLFVFLSFSQSCFHVYCLGSLMFVLLLSCPPLVIKLKQSSSSLLVLEKLFNPIF